MIDVARNYTMGLPIAASTYAERVDACMRAIHYGMYAIFILWGIFFVYCLLRFRRKEGVRALYPTGHGIAAFIPDVAVLVFEIWLIFFLGFPLWAHVKIDFPAEADSNVVELVGEQFAWGFQYPGADGTFGRRDPKYIGPSNTIGIDFTDGPAKDDFTSINELHVPLGKPTLLYMTAKDVIHSFFVPEFRVKQDLVPGMRIPVWFEPTQAGTYEIACAQLCGLGHYRMRGDVIVHTPEDFEAWKKKAAEEQAAANAPAS